jgi:hypothetical protein
MDGQRDISSVPAPFRRMAAAFSGQEEVGLWGGLLLRLYRFLGGDPSVAVAVTSAGSADPHGLPDNVPAHSAVLHVQGNAVAYTMDGTVPLAASSPQISEGSIITLTGQPSIKGFQFCSAVAGAATITGYYYT